MKSIVSLLILLCAAFGFSQSVDSTQTNLDKKLVKAIVNEKGEVVFVFHDGREAQVFYGPSASLKGQVKLQQVENSCEYDLKPASCTVDGFYQNYKIQLQWTKHSNSEKVGQVVEINYGGDGSTPPEPFEEDFILTDLNFKKLFDDKPQDFPSYKISCDQAQWIEKARVTEKNVTFTSISSEIMFENSETDVNENQTFAEIYNAQFDLTSANTYSLKAYQYSNSLISQGDPFLSNQVIHFVYQEKSKQCHVAFAANVSELESNLAGMSEQAAEIKNKKVLKRIGNFTNTETSFNIETLLRAEKDSSSGRYQ